MFKESSKSYTDALGKTNRIVEGTSIEGNIESLADFRLDGKLKGNFTSKGKLVVGPAGIVLGDINCPNVDVEGKVDGKIVVTEILNVKSKAVINGEVICGKLAVEPGADFNASCVMNPDSKAEQPADGK
ncbi:MULTISPECIES: bactofilin family protein [unclassified Flavobacterium]|uniref:bactofilin family protein n=1 Tax=unclassified Flavobacterium TaxID=196869 RepID=UPI0036191E4D